MFCERTKEGAAQTTVGEFQEETKNGEATVRAQQKRNKCSCWQKETKMECRPDCIRVQQDFFAFFATGLEVKPM
jgi:hypothetical protein